MKMNILIIILLLCACSSNPPKTVPYVDVKNFMGKWYVIASIPTFIDQNAFNAVETYTWNADKNRIDVDFKFNQNSFDGELKSYPQKAWIYNEKTNAEWRIQLFWPLKFAYLINDLAADYSYTVITVPDRKNVWIMARKPYLPEDVYQSIIQKLQQQSFELKDLKKVQHHSNPQDK
jgi:apolipoprotein D and lipocalin family protein